MLSVINSVCTIVYRSLYGKHVHLSTWLTNCCGFVRIIMLWHCKKFRRYRRPFPCRLDLSQEHQSRDALDDSEILYLPYVGSIYSHYSKRTLPTCMHVESTVQNGVNKYSLQMLLPRTQPTWPWSRRQPTLPSNSQLLQWPLMNHSMWTMVSLVQTPSMKQCSTMSPPGTVCSWWIWFHYT